MAPMNAKPRVDGRSPRGAPCISARRLTAVSGLMLKLASRPIENLLSPEFEAAFTPCPGAQNLGLARHDAIFDDKPIRDDISDIPSLRNGDLFEVELQFGCDRNGLRVP